MARIAFQVPCVPVAQPRQRHRIVAGNGGSWVQNYVPAKHKVQDFKASVRLAARMAYQGPPLEGPLALTATFVMPRPGRLIWKKRAMPRAPHEAKPDLDNLTKSLVDSMSGLLFRDDKQLTHYSLAKLYASGDEQPCVIVEIQSLEDVA